MIIFTKTLNHGLVLKKVHRVIKFNQKAWLEPYIKINTDPRKIARNGFEKNFFKLINNSVFGKTTESVRKHRDIKLITNRQEEKLFSIRTRLSYSKFFRRNFISNRNQKDSNNYEEACLFRIINIRPK